MEFIYDSMIDKYCWDQIAARTRIFNEEKKTDKFSVDCHVIRRFINVWEPCVYKEFRNGIWNIFNSDFPKEFKCYINSTPYSMEVPDGISISAGTQTPIRTICHEANHVMFLKSDFKKKYFPRHDMEDAKEIFTVLNNIYFQNIMEQQDIGWKKFWKERYRFLVLWLLGHPEVRSL